MNFAKDFMWGAASAAYQVEGAWNADGKGPSIWDAFTKISGKTFKGSNGDIAVDHYNRYREDVALMAEAGLKAYRFSVSWPRVFPDGNGDVNEAGLVFYDRLIDELLKFHITPVITLYHWDLPESLMRQYGGWESRNIISDFDRYARTLFVRWRHKVKHWITWNEQNYHFHHAFITSLHPPGVKDRRRFYEANHIAFLANARAIASFRELKMQGSIGPSFAYSPSYPATPAPEDILACENAEELVNDWWLDTYARGAYPDVALKILREKNLAPSILDGDFDLLKKGLPDFIGINYYQSLTYEKNPPDGVSEGHFNSTGIPGSAQDTGFPGLYKTVRNDRLERTAWDWNIDSVGLLIGLRRVYSRYSLPVIVTENGLGDFDQLTVTDEINDDARLAYLKSHVRACEVAIKAGVVLRGYFVWSFTDVLSWLNGYQKRYGLVYVNRDENDPKDLRRIKKKSFYWYRDFIRDQINEMTPHPE